MNPGSVLGQENSAVVEWQKHDFYQLRPNGTHYENQGGVLVAVPQPGPVSITANESGGDWWMDLKAVTNTNDEPIGYVAVGYSGAQNWGYTDHCYVKANEPSDPLNEDDQQLLNNATVRRGNLREAIALYDLNGQLQWYKSFYAGVFEGVIQDADYNLVVCGNAANSTANFFADITNPKALLLNPVDAGSTNELPSTGCTSAQGQMIVMKLNLEGNVIWNHLFNPSADPDFAMTRRSGGYDLVVTNKNGTRGYRVVGNAYPLVNGAVNASRRPYLVQLDLDGYKLWDHLIEFDAACWPVIGTNTGDPVWTNPVDVNAIDRVFDPATQEEHLVLSGLSWPYPAPSRAWLMYFNEPVSATGYVPYAWIKETTVDQAEFPIVADPAAHQISTDVMFKMENGAEKIIFPVVANIYGSWYAGGHYALNAPIYKIASNNPDVVEAWTDLGELHAFDFRLGVTETSDGNIAAVCTKWPAGYDFAGTHYGYANLDQAQRDCLANINNTNWNSTTLGCYWYWGSQSYVAKLNGSDLSEIWHYQWTYPYNEGGSTEDECFPGNVRRRQCNFRVVEAPDGGLVVCGNTGHNFDDAYLAKLRPCENSPAYANLPLDANGEYHITANTTWNTDMNVQGSMVVDASATLTIDGATIAFAPSTPQLTTNITVMPGGTLEVRNNAVLTVVNTCSELAMWDGVKVLGNGTTVGAGLVHLESHAKIANAQLAIRGSEGAPTDPFPFFGYTMAGGIIHAEDAIFENNRFSIALSHHEDIDPAVWGPSTFTRCQFITDMDYSIAGPSGAQVVLNNTANVPMESCTFKNTSGLNPARSNGIGIHAINTSIKVTGGTTPEEHGQFMGFDVGILHSTFAPDKLAKIDACDFSDNAQGMLIAGANNSRVTNCTFNVPDKDVTTGLGLEGAYGAYVYGCSGFEFEQNTFTGAAGGAYPKVGAVFYNTGIEDNMFYNNTFNGFTDQSQRSVGTIIMGDNAADDGTGLRIKCNDYSATSTNDYDVAFTGNAVSIAAEQGAQSPDNAAPAGNTWANVDALTCNGNEAQHFYVQGGVNAFQYWHHAPQPGIELVPHCSIAGNSLTNTNWYYEKTQSCPEDLSELVPLTDDGTIADNADLEYATLKDVYANWKDGGNTDGLIEYIRDKDHTSYDVRNQLMLVAPKVGLDAWIEVFHRWEPMNPWHLAQALLANSPLEPKVMQMLEEADIEQFYKDLVTDGQDGGVSMHSIYKSEIAHWYTEKADALQAMVRKSLLSGSSADRALTLQALADHYILSKDVQLYALHLAANEFQAARDLVTAQLGEEDADLGYWRVQDLWLHQLETGNGPSDLDSMDVAVLVDVAATGGLGGAQAESWLQAIGQSQRILLLLPDKNRAVPQVQVQRAPKVSEPLLSVYPNPAKGPFYLVYRVPDGVEKVEIRLHDPQGRLVRQEPLAAKNGIWEVTSTDLAEGNYIATLAFDGIQVGSAKVNVLH